MCDIYQDQKIPSEKNHKCLLCMKIFKTGNELAVHIKTHNEEKTRNYCIFFLFDDDEHLYEDQHFCGNCSHGSSRYF